jgi:surfeit locus 1 family protein
MMNNTTPKPNNSKIYRIYQILPWVAFILVFGGLMKLGFWQLSRAEQKTLLIEKSQAKKNQPAMKFEPASQLQDKQYIPIILHGKWSKSWSFYLDNRFQDGISGYNVFSLFEDDSGAKIFVDRGWQAIGNDRKFNYVAPNKDQIQVLGYIYQPSVYSVVKVPKLKSNTVLPIPGLDMPQFITTLAEHKITLVPFIVRQTFPEIETGLMRKWRIVGSPPERNLGYAVQWFLMALALLVLTVVSVHKKRKTRRSSSN